MRPSLRDAVAGGIWGLLIGDALGVPYEFSEPDELPSLDELELPAPRGSRGPHREAPVNAWSDDGAHALCLLASLLDRDRLDCADFGHRLLKWLDHGYMAVNGIVFDVGLQTHDALSALRSGIDAEQAGLASERNNGNGSLMRVLPLALWHRGSDEELVRDAALQSRVTHPHVRSQICCALYCLWVRATLRESSDAWRDATSVLRSLTMHVSVWQSELNEHVRPELVPYGSGSGYVVDCLHSARLAAREATFERVIRRAICFGNDTDTTAAVAGGIAGVRHGLSQIPAHWLAALPAREIVEPLIERLVARFDGPSRAPDVRIPQ